MYSIGMDTGSEPAGKVLLVEDNVVNQKVARRFLERLGCEVEVAGNGVEAVRAFEGGAFGLILMDVQMPVMDGYEATERIRSLESTRGKFPARTPVVALTADALPGHLDRCLQSGMDGLLTKPINAEQLEQMLVRFGLGASVREVALPCAAGPVPQPVDLMAFDTVTGGDGEFAAALARSYLDDSRELFTRIRTCLGCEDRAELARVVHQLAGASANIHATALRELCLHLERLAPSAAAAELGDCVARIGAELGRVGAALRQHSQAVHRRGAAGFLSR